MEETILTLHPEDKQGVRILKRRYDLVSQAILDALEEQGEITFKDLNVEVAGRLQETFDGSIPWYVVTVKLDLEARGIVERIEGAKPQRIRRGRGEPLPTNGQADDDIVDTAPTMQILEQLGTEQNRKVYRRHGAKEPLYGVSVAILRQVAKDIGKDRELAAALWETGNFDAMALATLIDDPEAITAEELDTRSMYIGYYHLADFFSTFVSKTRFAVQKMKKWSESGEEYVKRCGYSLVTALARNAALMDDATLARFIPVIAAEIHGAPNRAREAMNKALIEIGKRPGLRKEATEAALSIGPVSVDQGDTGCKTPDAYAELTSLGQAGRR